MQNYKRYVTIAVLLAAVLLAALTLQTNWFEGLLGGSPEAPVTSSTVQNHSQTDAKTNTLQTTPPQKTSQQTTKTSDGASSQHATPVTSSTQLGAITGEQIFSTESTVDPSGVTIIVTNHRTEKVGLRAIVSAGKRDAQGYAEIAPNETKTLKIEFPQLKAKETLNLAYHIGTLTGDRNEDISETLFEDRSERVREVPEELADAWNQGTFETLYDSLDYHFKKHGEEIDASNIVEYLEKSVAFRNQILKDKKDMQPSDLEKTYTIKVSSGKTPAHKYKHKKDKRYAILTDDEEKILSFGGK